MLDVSSSKQLKRKSPNPTGAGGLREHPENRNDGRWTKEGSFSYWMNYFKRLDKKEFQGWIKKNPNHNVAAALAYIRVNKSWEELKEFQEVANRTEGMPKQSMTLDGELSIKPEPILGKVKKNATNKRTGEDPIPE